jgi:hypothetical protein
MRLRWTGLGKHRDKTLSAPIRWPEREWVDVLGVDDAAKVFLTVGGGYAYVPGNPESTPDNEFVTLLGPDKAQILRDAIGAGSRRIPLANTFLARLLRSRGHNPTAIARKLRLSDTAVRLMLLPDDERRASSQRKTDAARPEAA